MKRRLSALIALLLFAFPVFAAAEPVPATPTDLDCPHEHVRTTIYFFDSPLYMAVSEEAHRVSGPATVESVCLDCGKLLSSELAANAEEIRPHSMKKGVCALCGYRQKEPAETPVPADLEGERTLYAQEDANAKGLLEMTLSREDLSELKNEGIITALIRGETGTTAVALQVDDMLTQVEQAGAVLYAELEEQEDSSCFAGLFLVSGSDERTAPAEDGIALRFYRERTAGSRAAFAPVDSDRLREAESLWNDYGYWSVPYLEEGTYFILQ